jgi:hypothetical protein
MKIFYKFAYPTPIVMYNNVQQEAERLPDGLEVYFVSFEKVD